MMIFRRILLLLAFACGCALSTSPARADSWVALHRAVYTSGNGAWRLVVTPAAPGDPPAGRGPSEGRLERRGPGRRWTVQWRRTLVNELAPAAALVSDDGRFIVTFDNWYSMGHGGNVVVIYDAAGALIRSFRLVDLLPADYVEAIPHSVSSILWSGGSHRFSAGGDSLLLEVATPSERMFDGPGPVTLEVALASGRPVPPAGPAWERALAATARVRALQRGAQARELAFMTDPLLGPAAGSRRQWEGYLYEAFARLDPAWEAGSPLVAALDAPGDPDYRTFLPFIGIWLSGPPEPGRTLLFGSPDEEDLFRVLAGQVGRMRPGRLRGVKVYIAAHDALWPRIAALFAPTGAELVQLDPTEPIQQRPERLRAYIARAQAP